MNIKQARQNELARVLVEEFPSRTIDVYYIDDDVISFKDMTNLRIFNTLEEWLFRPKLDKNKLINYIQEELIY